jgi:hypothetical protein
MRCGTSAESPLTRTAASSNHPQCSAGAAEQREVGPGADRLRPRTPFPSTPPALTGDGSAGARPRSLDIPFPDGRAPVRAGLGLTNDILPLSGPGRRHDDPAHSPRPKARPGSQSRSWRAGRGGAGRSGGRPRPPRGPSCDRRSDMHADPSAGGRFPSVPSGGGRPGAGCSSGGEALGSSTPPGASTGPGAGDVLAPGPWPRPVTSSVRSGPVLPGETTTPAHDVGLGSSHGSRRGRSATKVPSGGAVLPSVMQADGGDPFGAARPCALAVIRGGGSRGRG